MSNISQEQQLELAQYIQETFSNYVTLNEPHRTKLTTIFEQYTSFEQLKDSDWSSSFKVNYAHQIVNKTLPRLIAKNPRWLVDLKTDQFSSEDRLLEGEDRLERLKQMRQMSEGVQAYLTYIWERYNLREPARLWAKDMLKYGNAYAMIKFKYEMTRTKENGKIDEKVVGEYPTIEPISWTDIYVDPRYTILEDMPAIIKVTERVRFADLIRKKDKYFNLEKIEDLPTQQEFTKNPEQAKLRIYEITGIPTTSIQGGVNKNELTLKTFFGKYSLEGNDEKLYRVTTVNDYIVIEFEEITTMPIEDIKCFDESETHFATGMIEPILSLQEETNFKKNSASEYVNNALNRSWIWSPNSGVNPQDLISRPNNIIATTKDAVTAQNNLIELPHRNLPTDYFQEQNDIERQIQNATFSVDTSAQRSQQALTNTATGIRVKFFENNSVIDELRKHFEEGLEKLAYKLLQATFENMEDNIVIKKLGQEGFWEINKELLKDALNRYDIRVEVNSSSFDDIENRREDAIAFFNVMLQGAEAGVSVDFNEAMKDVINTFEKRDPERYISQQAPIAQGGGEPLQAPGAQPTNAAALTEAVAKGGVTSGL